MVDEFEQKLATQQWLEGDEPGEADKEAMKIIGNNAPSVSIYPHTFAWYSLASHFKWAQEILKDAPPAVKKSRPVQLVKPAAASEPASAPAKAPKAEAPAQKKEQPAQE